MLFTKSPESIFPEDTLSFPDSRGAMSEQQQHPAAVALSEQLRSLQCTMCGRLLEMVEFQKMQVGGGNLPKIGRN